MSAPTSTPTCVTLPPSSQWNTLPPPVYSPTSSPTPDEQKQKSVENTYQNIQNSER